MYVCMAILKLFCDIYQIKHQIITIIKFNTIIQHIIYHL